MDVEFIKNLFDIKVDIFDYVSYPIGAQLSQLLSQDGTAKVVTLKAMTARKFERVSQDTQVNLDQKLLYFL